MTKCTHKQLMTACMLAGTLMLGACTSTPPVTKEVSIGYLLKNKSARRGSNPRPPPWQGGAPPLSHSRALNARITIL